MLLEKNCPDFVYASNILSQDIHTVCLGHQQLMLMLHMYTRGFISNSF